MTPHGIIGDMMIDRGIPGGAALSRDHRAPIPTRSIAWAHWLHPGIAAVVHAGEPNTLLIHNFPERATGRVSFKTREELEDLTYDWPNHIREQTLHFFDHPHSYARAYQNPARLANIHSRFDMPLANHHSIIARHGNVNAALDETLVRVPGLNHHSSVEFGLLAEQPHLRIISAASNHPDHPVIHSTIPVHNLNDVKTHTEDALAPRDYEHLIEAAYLHGAR